MRNFGWLWLLVLPGIAQADPVVLSTTVAGSISDTDGDGIGDSGSYYGVVIRGGNYEHRAFAEYDVTPIHGRNVLSARLDGSVETNGNWNLGPTISVSAYVGNGSFDVSDFARPTLAIDSFRVPAGTWDSTFTLDVTAAVRRLLAQNATWVAFRFDAVQNMDSVIIGGHAGDFNLSLSVEQAPAVPEPGSMLLLGTGLVGVLRAVRKRRLT